MKKKLLLVLLSVLLLVGCESISLLTHNNTKNSEETTTTEIVTSDTIPITTSSTTTTITTTTETTVPTTTTSTTVTTVLPKTTTARVIATTQTPVTTTVTTTTTTTTTAAKLTEEQVYQILMSFQSTYPTGTVFDNSTCYIWKGSINSKGCGCHGFAYILSDAAFGDKSAYKTTNFSNVKVGDIIRYLNDTHTFIVLAVNSSTYTVAEANVDLYGDGVGRVYWGREVQKSEVLETGTYRYTRY